MGWIIFSRVILSVVASALQKRLLLNRAGVYQSWILTYGLMLGPAAVLAVSDLKEAPASFWMNIAIGGGIDALGNLAMIAALRVTDLSVFGPLNALRPILALTFGWLLLDETPSFAGIAGVIVTVLGGIVLFAENKTEQKIVWRETVRAVALRITGLSLGVFGAVFLKRAAEQSSAEATVAAWTVCGLLVLFCAAALHGRAELHKLSTSLRIHFHWLLAHSLSFGVMIWLTIRIFQETLLAYSFVYFQLGMVLQVFVGRLFFQERAFARRLLAAVIMAGGSVLVLWKG